MKKLFFLILTVLTSYAVQAQKSDDFDPESPVVPYENYFDHETGELCITHCEKDDLSEVMDDLLDRYSIYDVKKIYVACPMSDYDIAYLFRCTNATTIDMRNATEIKKLTNSYMFNSWISSDLEQLYLPNCITEIASNMLGARNLNRIALLAQTPPTIPTDFLNTRINSVEIYVPDEALNAYKSATTWSKMKLLPMSALKESGVQLSSVSLTIKNQEGEDVTEKVSIKWTNLDGEELGSGNSVKGLRNGDQVIYRISLSNELAQEYKAPQSASVTCNGSDQSLELTLEPLPVQFYSGTRIKTVITLTNTKDENIQTSSQLERSDLQFTVTNASGRETIPHQFDGEYLTLTKTISKGDELKVSVSSASNLFQTTSAAVQIGKSSATVQLNLKENGHAVITNDTPELDIMCMVYDAQGQRVATSYNNNGKFVITNLPNGKYTAAVMANDNNLALITSLSSLEKILKWEVGYTKVEMEAKAGQVSNYNVSVGTLKTYQSNLQPVTSVDKKTMSVGEYFTYKVYEGGKAFLNNYTDKKITFELPEGLYLLEGSPYDEITHNPLDYYMEGRNVVVPIDKTVKLCFMSRIPGTYNISASIQYKNEGITFTEPFGSATVEYEKISISVSDATSKSYVYIYGSAEPGAKVNIYDNNVLVCSTGAMMNGEWSVKAPVNKKSTDSFHQIYAEYIGSDNLPIKTEEEMLYVSDSACYVKSVKMYSDPGIEVEYNMETGTAKPSYYSYNPSCNKVFTFVAELENLDPNRLHGPKFYVSTTSNTIRTLNAHYDETLGAYTAMTYFTSAESLPENVYFDYAYEQPCNTKALADRLYADEMACIADVTDLIDHKLRTSMKDIQVLVDTEEMLEYTFKLDYTEEVFHAKMHEITATQAQTLLNEAGNLAIRTEHGTDNEKLITWHCVNENDMWQIIHDEKTNYYMLSELNIEGEEVKANGPRKIITLAAVAGLAVVGWKTYNIAKTLIDHAMNFAELKYQNEAFIQEMTIMRNQSVKSINSLLKKIYDALLAKCKDGKSKMGSKLVELGHQYQDLSEGVKTFVNQYDILLGEYADCVGISVAGQVVSTLVDAGLTIAGKKFSDATTAKASSLKSLGEKGGELVGNAVGEAFSNTTGALKDLFPDLPGSDYKGMYEHIMDWATKQSNKHIEKLGNFLRYVKSIDECNDDDKPKNDDKEEEKPKQGGNKKKRTRRTRPIVDPSGYVYEGVESNRLEGVTATLYYRENEDVALDDAVLWVAEEYGQKNPVTTQQDGMYQWDVPQGLWQVRFQKEGYADTQTEWLPVPPPQLEVNIAMTTTEKPTIKDAKAYTDGVTMEFSKYMNTSSVAQSISVTAGGKNVEGTVSAMNEEAGKNGTMLASLFRFTP